MQLLALSSDEGKPQEGLGLIDGNIKKLVNINSNEKIPHIGWNQVNQKQKSRLFNNIPDSIDYYFLHSYHFMIQNPNEIIGETPYCGKFISAVNRSNVYGVQFHPEKSAKYGLQLLTNFLNIS